jgi:hypothetical protein
LTADEGNDTTDLQKCGFKYRRAYIIEIVFRNCTGLQFGDFNVFRNIWSDIMHDNRRRRYGIAVLSRDRMDAVGAMGTNGITVRNFRGSVLGPYCKEHFVRRFCFERRASIEAKAGGKGAKRGGAGPERIDLMVEPK